MDSDEAKVLAVIVIALVALLIVVALSHTNQELSAHRVTTQCIEMCEKGPECIRACKGEE